MNEVDSKCCYFPLDQSIQKQSSTALSASNFDAASLAKQDQEQQ